MPVQGLRTTTNFITNQRPENWREALLMLYPNAGEGQKAPLTALTSLLNSEKTDDPIFHWWEKELDDRRLTLSAAILAGDLTIPVTLDATSLKANDLILIEQTGEIVRVNTIASDTSFTVVRAQAGTSAAAVNIATAGVNPNMTVIGSAFEEGSLSPNGVSWDPTERFNFTQIFRSSLEITRTAQRTRLRTGDAVKEARRECLEYFSVDIERAFWFSRASATTLNGRPFRTTDGIVRQITARAPSNVVACPGGNLSLTQLEIYLRDMFAFGASEKMGFCSNRVILAIQQAIRRNSEYTIMTGIKEYGMRVMRLICPFGELVLKPHPLFNQMTSGTTGGTPFDAVDSNLYVLDMSKLRYRYIDDITPQGNLQAIGQDAMKAGYLAEIGLEVQHARAHYIITGIRQGVLDV